MRVSPFSAVPRFENCAAPNRPTSTGVQLLKNETKTFSLSVYFSNNYKVVKTLNIS